MSVIIETSIGDFTVDLFADERPRCCLNFLKLCKIKYYNFSLFYSVQSNLVAQTGDPTATGRGGESIYAHMYGEQARFFDMEVVPRIKHTRKGLVSMVNNGSGMHGSQFFITLADSLDYLDGKHTVFGEVVEGFDILNKLNNTYCGEDNRPHQDIRIYHTIILDDPFDDPDGLVVPSMSPGPTEEMLNSDHIPCDADVDEDKKKTEAELAEMEEEKEAKANTQILEMVGDLPSSEVAPPENVLFVCKLNPVTTSDDLEIIFSRFGNINNCDVIKDNKTGESLQYAFIEFDNPQSCENAYFKMDNVLIDDRRIHVDFSQSVSKLKWKGKGKGVDVLDSGDAPVYVLKNQQRRDNNYDLVYDEDLPAVDSSKREKQKKNARRERSKSPKERRPKTGRDNRLREHERDNRDVNDRSRHDNKDRRRHESREGRRSVDRRSRERDGERRGQRREGSVENRRDRRDSTHDGKGGKRNKIGENSRDSSVEKRRDRRDGSYDGRGGKRDDISENNYDGRGSRRDKSGEHRTNRRDSYDDVRNRESSEERGRLENKQRKYKMDRKNSDDESDYESNKESRVIKNGGDGKGRDRHSSDSSEERQRKDKVKKKKKKRTREDESDSEKDVVKKHKSKKSKKHKKKDASNSDNSDSDEPRAEKKKKSNHR